MELCRNASGNCLILYFYVILPAGIDFLAKKNPVGSINQAEFEQTCGVGIEITPEQIEECVS